MPMMLTFFKKYRGQKLRTLSHNYLKFYFLRGQKLLTSKILNDMLHYLFITYGTDFTGNINLGALRKTAVQNRISTDGYRFVKMPQEL
jgi:hypothetical protein